MRAIVVGLLVLLAAAVAVAPGKSIAQLVCDDGFVQHPYKADECYLAGSEACVEGGYCFPGTVCSPSGGCSPLGGVDCGGGYCSAGEQCAAGGGCIPLGSMDCGDGTYCDAGTFCVAGGCQGY